MRDNIKCLAESNIRYDNIMFVLQIQNPVIKRFQQIQQLMTSQIGLHVQYLLHTYNILILKIDDKYVLSNGF